MSRILEVDIWQETIQDYVGVVEWEPNVEIKKGLEKNHHKESRN